ncbi:tetratricopeptide repeat protein [Ginsengibacter hankyongi]|uniref:Tetratricopeptide repeat protein n=1 Tax=Ginsengibacter hankyongi TaxID=2607284 RepID=A0A5J5IK66_9BACT|nr:tetratricopeptide repeat protein [Ginsengibacter hankyongi]KAA9039409.1 tetratricopeptide repeat protein [Ginsengibacter hankyongi]
MTKIFFLISFSISVQIANAQNAKDFDSLVNVLTQNKSGDSSRVKTLLNIANILIYNNPDSSMKYTDEAMELSQQIKWQKGIALSFRQMGYVYYILTDKFRAMDYYLKALKAGQSINNNFFNATIYNNIANIYADLKNYKKALDYYSKYLSIAQQVKSKTDEMNAFINIGDIYTEQNSLPLGLAYFNKALLIANETGNKRIGAAILNNLGEIFIKHNNYEMALSNFEKSLSLAEETRNMNAKATALNGLGEIYLHQKKYKQAEDFSNRSLQLSKELGDISWQANALETLSKTYEEQKDFANAFYTYQQAVVLKDSTLSDKKKQDITRLEMQYNFDKKEAEINAANDKRQALAAAEINRQKILKNASLAIGFILMLVAVAGIILYKRRNDTLEKKKEAEFNTQVAYTELKALRAQMNPHFIYNSLNSINDYIDKHDTEMATLYTTKFAKLMRMILENSEQKEVRLADDLNALELYMQLESMRMQNKFSYEIKVDEDIDRENTLIPPLILQPFVENSIWHGISKKQGAGKILVSIHKEGNMINCVVEDNGIGILESSNAETEKEVLLKIVFWNENYKSKN